MVWIKNLITSHDSDEVFSIRQIDDIVGPTGNHIDCFNLISTHFKLNHFPGIYISLLNQTMAVNNNKLFPLGVVPVLPLGNTRFGYQ